MFRSFSILKPVFNKILIANGGEVACRVVHTAKRMGIKTVAVYSDRDRDSQHLTNADEAINLGSGTSGESYFQINKIIKLATSKGCEAIHPGYGLLSESEDFLNEMSAKDLVHIGPNMSLDNGTIPRNVVLSSGVNPIPGSVSEVGTVENVLELGQEIGYPILIKSAQKTITHVANNEEEATKAFRMIKDEMGLTSKDKGILVEKMIERAKIVGVQVLADKYGGCVYLPGKGHSFWNNKQSLKEQFARMTLDYKTRRTMGEQACSLMKSIGYNSYGVVNFMLDSKNNFYLSKVKPGLQIGYPLVGLKSGLDLIEETIRIAAGERLTFAQNDLLSESCSRFNSIRSGNKSIYQPVALLSKHQKPNTNYARIETNYCEEIINSNRNNLNQVYNNNRFISKIDTASKIGKMKFRRSAKNTSSLKRYFTKNNQKANHYGWVRKKINISKIDMQIFEGVGPECEEYDDHIRHELFRYYFQRFFGDDVQYMTQSPGRDNGQGEHVDYSSSQFNLQKKTNLFSFGHSIQYNYLSGLSFRSDNDIKMVHLDVGESFQFNLSLLPKMRQICKENGPDLNSIIPRWARHALGTMKAGEDHEGIKLVGMNLLLTSSVPFGGGLSNSAANCCAMALLLNGALKGGSKYKIENVSELIQLARWAQAGEHDPFVGGNCGLLDQLISLAGQHDHMVLINYGYIVNERILQLEPKLAQRAILKVKSGLPKSLKRILINSMVTHDLQQTEYSDRQKELDLAFNHLQKWTQREFSSTGPLTLKDLNDLIAKLDPSTHFVTLEEALGGRSTLDLLQDELPRELKENLHYLKAFVGNQKRNFLSRDEINMIVQKVKLDYQIPKPELGQDPNLFLRHQTKGLTKEKSFAFLLQRMRHQLTSSMRTPLTAIAAKKGDVDSFLRLIDGEGLSLRESGDMKVTGLNGAQDKLLDLGHAIAKKMANDGNEISVAGRMLGGGGGGFDGFYINSSNVKIIEEWVEKVQVQYSQWWNQTLAHETKTGKNYQASDIRVIRSRSSDGANYIDPNSIKITNNNVLKNNNNNGNSTKSNKHYIRKTKWGKIDNRQVNLYTLTNKNGSRIRVCNYGATVISVEVPDYRGKIEDIALGHDEIKPYSNDDHPYFGSTVGRYANRIANGRFAINGQEYKLFLNNNGKHCLHGGKIGFDRKFWEIEQEEINNEEEIGIKFTRKSPNGEEGFPGNLMISVTFLWTNDNELKIFYEAETDQPTVVNLTNHTYFNLKGEENTTILDHHLKINSDYFTPSKDSNMIPTGEIRPILNTNFDFLDFKPIGERINNFDQDEQLKNGNGYDHNYILNKTSKDKNSISFAAEIFDPISRRAMQVYTTEPGIQLYTGNFLANTRGKNGETYQKHSGFALETQHFPNSPNQLNFPSTLLNPGEIYESKTIYKFTIKKTL
ncbi:aldose 1-epimerase [Anaeramoeba flamelloides]|uniref:Aldose 1-epimerase n=1 Tax=Anaeramoeba flamelloides TaxID=1746091 RepID=A0ABQ8Y1P9_9EUKA|nr:aldose 1-epimerase [Anaeramoeba flamelloides]